MECSVAGMADMGRDPFFEVLLVYSVIRHNVYGVKFDYFTHI
jgi:hypothetical protein